MKVLLLAAGYGTRLQCAFADNPKYSHLISLPKGLIPVNGKPVVAHWVEQLTAAQIQITDIYLITNQKYFNQYQEWASTINFPNSNIINDLSTENSNRLGAIRDIQFFIEKVAILDDLLIIGTDTLFKNDFNLRNVLYTFQTQPYSLILSYHDENTENTGIMELNQHNLVTNFFEKPSRGQTASRLASPCFYALKRHILPLIQTYLRQSSSEQIDAPGYLIAWLHKKTGIQAYSISGRYDIGNLESYELCLREMEASSMNRSNSRKPFINEDNQWTAGIALGLIGVASLLMVGKMRSRRS